MHTSFLLLLLSAQDPVATADSSSEQGGQRLVERRYKFGATPQDYVSSLCGWVKKVMVIVTFGLLTEHPVQTDTPTREELWCKW